MSILSQLAVTQAAALSVSTLGRIDYFTDSADGKLKEYDQTNTLKDVGGSSIAGDVAYTLTVPVNWDGSPATAQAALDELASRIKNIEDTRPYTVTNDLVIFDRDIQIPQNSLFVGDAIKLSDLAQSLGYQTAYDEKEYIILSYEITANESKRPKAKVFGAPSAFDLQPLDSVQQSFTSVLIANIQSLQQVIGKTYSLKASCDQDLLIEVFRIGEGSGVDTLIVNETIPAAQTNINGFDFDLIPLVDFENMKNYRIEFTPLNGGTLQIKGGIISTIFVPYIRRQVGWVYVNKDLSFLEDLDTKEDSFSKNTAFNKNFGTASGDVLEGDTRTINAGEITTLSNTSGTNTGDETASTIKTKYESNTNTNAFTDSEKTKLSGLESSKFVGEFTSLSALQTAFPTANVGSYAYVDTGVGVDVEQYIWDDTDSDWVLQQGQSTAETPASIKSKYESNPDTNAFTDSEKTKLSNQSGTNTGDETTTTIQTKRPLKTIEGQDLEGSGNINITSGNVGLGLVDNTSDLDKPISNATQTALNAKKDDFTENTAFNKDFGTSAGEVLEGDTRTINTGEITKLTNTSGTNTGDETTTSIQTKRPIKTVNGVTLEGTGNVPISGTVEPLPICVLTSTNSTLTASQSTPAVLPWNVETEKDTGFTHSNSTNNSRLQVDADGTYQIQANIRMFSAGQRVQFVGKYLIDGVVQSMPMGSSYIRNSGSSSDFWTCIINPPPVKLTAGQYIQVQIQVEAQTTTALTGTFQGSDSTFSITKLQGVKGEAGPTGAGANIILQKDDSTVGTTTDTLNFEGNATLTDEGSGKTTVLIDGGQTWYKQQAVNTVGGTVNAAFGSPVECVPFSGTFEITVVETGVYVIYGVITTRANLNSDNGALELAYGIDTGGGASIGPQPYREAMNGKKNRRNGIQGTWGNVSLTAGDKVHLFLSTLGDSTTWDSGEIFIQTWK